MVSNHGTGIGEDFKDKVFNKFPQGDSSSDTRQKGDTGLRLAIIRKLVEAMEGTIGFDSPPNVLTTFYVELPVVQRKSDKNKSEIIK